MKISKSAVLGFAIGILCIISAVFFSGDMKQFWNLPSFFITIGGTVGVMVVSFPMSKLKTIGSVMAKALGRQKMDLLEDIDTIVSVSESARRNGLLSLDSRIDEYTDEPFFKQALMLLVDISDKEELRECLMQELRYASRRHKDGQAMIGMIATTTPSLGLLGTYVGLIPMLTNLDDPASLGPLMAVELVSSFYGAFIAYIIFSPMAKRLKSLHAEEMLRNQIIVEGILYIKEEKNPRAIRESLTAAISRKTLNRMGRPRSADRAPGTGRNDVRVLPYEKKNGIKDAAM